MLDHDVNIEHKYTPSQSGQLLTVDEVAEVLRATPPTVRVWIREGVIQASKVGKRWLVHQSAVDDYLLRQQNIEVGKNKGTIS